MPRKPSARLAYIVALFLTPVAGSLSGCDEDFGPRPPASTSDVYGLANGCFAIDAAAPGKSSGALLVQSADGLRFSFGGHDVATASKLTVRASDLGTYVLRDAEGRFVLGADDGTLSRVATLESDVSRNEDGFISPAEWNVVAIDGVPGRFHFQQRSTNKYLATHGLVSDAAAAAGIAFYETTGCEPYPELTLDATGSITRTHFDDGTLFGIVDAHEHIFSNMGFGAGGVFHGAPYHRLGVEYALPDCTQFHGVDGRSDLVGFFFDGDSFDFTAGAAALISGDVGSFNHNTSGYPLFVDWPNSWASATHQTQYYKWIERAYLAGVRLVVQHATSNETLCEMGNAIGTQPQRISCNEMVAAERIIDEARAMERYIDAQAGGPGRGFFRIVTTPAEARQVIADGKLAVILGIETSQVMDCFTTPRDGFPVCDAALVRQKLDYLQSRGVRALFPVHKYDNAFSAGDGMRGFIELGNFIDSGHYSNFTDVNCPDVPAVFDHGNVTFGGINMPRAVYDSPPDVDMSAFSTSPVKAVGPFLSALMEPPLVGNYCQAAGLTPLGETLIQEMMLRGMIIEVDHLPRRSYQRAYELLTAANYPAAGTHGSDNRGELYTLGGISTLGLDRCQDPTNPDAPAQRIQNRIATITANGGYPAQGFGFDYNGFAHGPRPRFGADTSCGSAPQSNPMSYPFTSYAGDVTFTQPMLGSREVDFDNEGMIHIGLIPELIQDARNVGVSDADLEPIFRSAEGYIRMWERAEARAAELRAALP